jgi:hypothetical protein
MINSPLCSARFQIMKKCKSPLSSFYLWQPRVIEVAGRVALFTLALCGVALGIGCQSSTEKPPAEQVAQSTGGEDNKSSPGAYAGPLTITVGGKIGFVDRSGKLLINPQFDSAQNFSEGMSLVCLGSCPFFEITTKADDSKYGFIDEKGQFVVNPQYDGAMSFSQGLAAVCLGRCGYADDGSRKWGFLDKNGNIAIPLQFGYVYSFADGLAPACVGKCTNYGTKFDGKWGFIDKSGKFIITPQFDDVNGFQNGIAQVTIGKAKDAKKGYIDKTGKFVWNPTN